MATIDNSNSSIYRAINEANQTDSTSSSASSTASETSDMFMELLIAQLQNQDPTNPTDTSEYMNQLATLTQVESTLSLSDTLESLSTSLTTSQNALQASSMVGQDIYVVSSTTEMAEDGVINGAYVLNTSASDVAYAVYDSEGKLVDSASLGSQTAGTLNFSWNGSGHEAGTYTVVLQADTGSGYKEIDAYLPQNVNSVTLGANGSGMTINTNIGQYTMDDVLQIG